MAQELTCHYAIYDTFNYQQGSDPAAVFERQQDLIELLHAGDSALDRSRGYFFGPVSDQFVVCYEQKREDRHSRDGSMWYFDLFWTPIRDVEAISLESLLEALQAELSSSFTAEIEDTVTVEVRNLETAIRTSSTSDVRSREEHEGTWQDPQESGLTSSPAEDTGSTHANAHETRQQDSGHDTRSDSNNRPAEPSASDRTDDRRTAQDNDTASSESTVDERPPDITFLAQFWEQYRRDNHQLRASVADLDAFRFAVDGSLSRFTCLSTMRRRTDTFDVVLEPWEETLTIDEYDLAEQIETLRKADELSVENLPTYRDEFLKQRERNQRRLRRNKIEFDRAGVDRDFESELEGQIDKLRADLHEELAETLTEAAAIYMDVWTSDRNRQTGDDGALSKLRRGVVGSAPERDSDELVKRIAAHTTAVDEETIKFVADEMADSEAGLMDTPEQRLVEFERALVEWREQLEKDLTLAVVGAIEDVKRSPAYERARTEQTESRE